MLSGAPVANIWARPKSSSLGSPVFVNAILPGTSWLLRLDSNQQPSG
jgi:hypothetical protein